VLTLVVNSYFCLLTPTGHCIPQDEASLSLCVDFFSGFRGIWDVRAIAYVLAQEINIALALLGGFLLCFSGRKSSLGWVELPIKKSQDTG
jgi:hypothetical protein